MDHNYDLLKLGTHKKTQSFIETLLNLNLYPTITRPTRITHSTATLIDNIFILANLYKIFESSISINDILDHLSTLTLLRQTKVKENNPLIFNSRNLTESNKGKINRKLTKVDWMRVLNGKDCNENFNKFNNKLTQILDKISPLKTIYILGKRHFNAPWIARGLEISSRKKLRLYKQSILANSTMQDQTRYKNYRNLYNKIKREMKIKYYSDKISDC